MHRVVILAVLAGAIARVGPVGRERNNTAKVLVKTNSGGSITLQLVEIGVIAVVR